MAARNKRFTIYDMMDAKGVFEANPANSESPEHKGPVSYPKMFYHPAGESRVTVMAETVVTPFGPKLVGEQREIISKVANSAEDEKALRAAGWHDHPAKAIAAGGGEAPAISSAQRIDDLQSQIARLTAELDASSASKTLGKTKSSGSAATSPSSAGL